MLQVHSIRFLRSSKWRENKIKKNLSVLKRTSKI